MSDLLIYAFDVAAVTVLAYGLYFRRHRRRDMLLAYLGLNIGVMAVATALREATATAGIGLGLFGILSIIRLRSSELPQEEVAYYFAALALGLLCGVHPDPKWLAPLLGSLLLAVMFVADHPQLLGRYRQQALLLDAAFTDERHLVEHLEMLLGADVVRVVTNKVDLVHDTTSVDVRYRLRSEAAAPVSTRLVGSALQGSRP